MVECHPDTASPRPVYSSRWQVGSRQAGRTSRTTESSSCSKIVGDASEAPSQPGVPGRLAAGGLASKPISLPGPATTSCTSPWCLSTPSILSSWPTSVKNLLWEKPAAFSVSCGVVFGLMWFLANRECGNTSICVGLHTQVSAAVALGVGTLPRAVVYSLSRWPQWGTHPSCVLHVFRPKPHLRMLVLGSCW